MTKVNEELLQFLNAGHTCFQVIDEVRSTLHHEGFEELSEGQVWELKEGGKYFTVRNESSILAFQLPTKAFNGFMIGASHSDSPTFKIKDNPEMISDGYVKLNVEGYGGMIDGTWMDRPLSVAGRIVVKEGNHYVTKLVDVDDDFLMIPNLAIHMDRTANANHTWNDQKDMLPIIGSEKEAKGKFMEIVAKSAGVKAEDILGHDLYLYIREKGRVWGAEKEYVSAGHLDDLQCAFGCMKGFLASSNAYSVPVLAIFDNEEVGSRTKQGANSTFLYDTLRRIVLACGGNEETYIRHVANSFMVSADNAHAVHPNSPEKADPVNRPHINEGIVVKFHGGQAYTTDAISAAIFRDLCAKVNVPTQVFTNRSDSRGGSTLGNLSATHVSLNTVDIGLPQLAMHSCYETAGTKDTHYLCEAMKEVFSASLKDCGHGNYELVK